MNETLELLQFPYSHFNEKARWALDLKRVPHTRRSLLPGPHAVTVQRLTGQTTVPVLRLGEEIIDGSARIIDTLEKHWAAAGTEEGLDFVAARAGLSGHLVGDSFTVADLAAAALLAPAANPPDSPMSRPEPIPISIQSWHERWEGQPGIEWVLRQYRENRPPSAELCFE